MGASKRTNPSGSVRLKRRKFTLANPLSFVLAGTHRGNQAAGCGEQHSGAGEAKSFAVPEAELASCERIEIEDGIKTPSPAVTRTGIAAGVKRGNSIAQPVAIVGNFGGGELGIHRDRAAGDRIE